MILVSDAVNVFYAYFPNVLLDSEVLEQMKGK